MSCALPTIGTVVHCIAHFTDSDAMASVVYWIKTTVKVKTVKAKVITGTTTAHYCTSKVTRKKLACRGSVQSTSEHRGL